MDMFLWCICRRNQEIAVIYTYVPSTVKKEMFASIKSKGNVIVVVWTAQDKQQMQPKPTKIQVEALHEVLCHPQARVTTSLKLGFYNHLDRYVHIIELGTSRFNGRNVWIFILYSHCLIKYVLCMVLKLAVLCMLCM